MGLKLANNALSRLAAGISPTDVTVVLVPGGGAAFPTLGAGDYFPATIVKADGTLEIVKVTARATDVLTVVRAQENTTAKSFNAGDRLELRMTAGTYGAQLSEVEARLEAAESGIATQNNLHPSGTALTPVAQWSDVPQMVTDNVDLTDELNAQAQALADRTEMAVRRATVPIMSFDGTNVPDKALIYFADRDTVGDGAGGPLRFLAGSIAPADGVTVYAVPGGRLVREGWSIFGVSVKWAGAKGDGVTDDTAAIQRAINAAVSTVIFPKGNYRVTSTISVLGNSPSLQGIGKRYNAGIQSRITIDHAGDGIYVNGTSHIGTVIEDLTVERGSGFAAQGVNINFDGFGGSSNIIAAIGLSRVYVNGGEHGIRLRGVINASLRDFTCQGQATAGVHFYGTGSPVNGSNNIEFTNFNIYNVTSGAGIRYEGADCGRSHTYKNGTIENCGRPIIVDSGDIAQNIQFQTLWLELNAAPMQLKGGRKIKFLDLRNAQAGQDLIDPATFGATDVEFDGVMGASVTATLGLPGVSVRNFERSKRAWSASVSDYAESSLKGTLMPQAVSANLVSAASIVGAVHQSGMYLKNYLENWNIGGTAQWTKPGGVTAATDPLGGTEAWSINASQTITGARQATIPDNVVGQTMEYVVWAKGVGTIELYTRPDGFAKRCEFQLSTQEWTRLTMRYVVEDATNDRATTFGMIVTIATANAISIWRPGIYAGFSCVDGRPVSASGSFEGGGVPTGYISGERQGRNLIVYGTSAPTVGTWSVGDKVLNTSTVAGGNIGWVCVASGTPGTWKTFGAISV